MARKRSPRVVYYTDPLQDEFSTAQIRAKKIDGNYRYLPRTPLRRPLHFFWYRMVATPLAFLYLKLHFHHRIVGREKLQAAGRAGFFLYGNHTQPTADALIPTFVAMPRHVYVIVHPNNVSMPVLGRITPWLGALPLPDDAAAGRHFWEAVRTRVTQGCPVCIYPEAHIWPYYTGIRPFTDASFAYPVMLHKPVYCFTNTYMRWHRKGVRLCTWVDGPFYPDETLPPAARRAKLRDEVLAAMRARAACNEVTVIDYRPREEAGDVPKEETP